MCKVSGSWGNRSIARLGASQVKPTTADNPPLTLREIVDRRVREKSWALYFVIHFKKMNFKEQVYSIVKKIPRGKVLTYKEIATRVGKPNASRAVGNVLNKNFDPSIPCHRVIRSDGKLGGYNRGSESKAKILKQEGYRFTH